MAHADVTTLTVVAPAKVNLFLHVTGRRADGYHELETLMALVDLCDSLALTLRDDAQVVREGDVDGVEAANDLALRAARALQGAAGVRTGVAIALDKRIPLGAGLGGGSSDAASVLLALNRLWHLDWPRAELSRIAATLGADVPFFVGGGNAIARGIGDVLEPVTLPAAWLVLVHPQAHVRTADVFAARELTRDTASAKIDVFSEGYGRNDLAAVTAAGFATVAQALAALPGARMTGSGSCVFAAFAAEQDARAAQSRIAARWNTRLVRTLAAHPLAGFAR
jgi:4-diphosphocytidyl-2-C-methyl-D-erythritol kinase